MLEGEWVRDKEKLLGSSVEHESLDLLPGRPPTPGGLLMGAVCCGVHTLHYEIMRRRLGCWAPEHDGCLP